MSTDFGDEDLYALLSISFDSKNDQIKKAYRKAALEHHPDKNPDKKDAAETFNKIQRAYEILMDEKARAAYDDVRKAKMARKAKFEGMDAKRRQMKTDLEERENAWKRRKEDEYTAKRRLEAEIERLRNEGFRRRKKMDEEIYSHYVPPNPAPSAAVPDATAGVTADSTVKVTWDKGRPGAYTEASIKAVMMVFGQIDTVVISARTNNALVCFKNSESALKAYEWYSRDGREFKASWPPGSSHAAARESPSSSDTAAAQSRAGSASFSSRPSPAGDPRSSSNKDRDYESLVMMRMRQAAERQRIIAELEAEQNPSSSASSSGAPTANSGTDTRTPQTNGQDSHQTSDREHTESDSSTSEGPSSSAQSQEPSSDAHRGVAAPDNEQRHVQSQAEVPAAAS